MPKNRTKAGCLKIGPRTKPTGLRRCLKTGPRTEMDKGLESLLNYGQLNFHILKDLDYHAISRDINTYDWEGLQNSCTAEEYPPVFNGALLDICRKHVPLKRLKTNRRRVANAPGRRQNRIRSRLRKLDESSRSYAELIDNLFIILLYQDLAATKASASPTKRVVTGQYLKSNSHSHLHPNLRLLIHSLALREMCSQIRKIKGTFQSLS